MFGSLHNNARLDVSLLRGEKVIARSPLVAGEDLPEDHLPLGVVWSHGAVTVTERKGNKAVTLTVPQDGI